MQVTYMNAREQAQRHLQGLGYSRTMFIDAGMPFAELLAWATSKQAAAAATIDIKLNMPPHSPGTLTWASDLQGLLQGKLPLPPPLGHQKIASSAVS